MSVVKLPPKPANDPGTEFLVESLTTWRSRIGAGSNVLCPLDPEEYSHAVGALKAALRFLDDEA